MGKGLKGRAKGFIRGPEVHFIEMNLQGTPPGPKKQALQLLCKLVRDGYRLRGLNSVRALVILNLRCPDLKVRRWALNALTLIGSEEDVEFILTVLDENRHVDEIFVAGLTALAALLPKDRMVERLASRDIQLSTPVILALSQNSSGFDEELSKVRVDVQSASPGVLKSASLLIGLRRAPDHIFSHRHPASEVIGELNTHDDPIVSQYSFWATVENPSMGLSSLGIHPGDIVRLPPNAQAWAYRIFTKDEKTAEKHYEVTLEGAGSEYAEVREGVASGLRGVYYDSLDVDMLEWYFGEADQSVLDRNLEHMTANVTRTSGYRGEVEDAYRSAPVNGVARARLEAACVDDDLTDQFKLIALKTGEPDLFAAIKGDNVSNHQTFNVAGSLNTGGISTSGTGNVGDVQINNTVEAQDKAADLLRSVEEALRTEAAPGTKEGVELAKKASEEPSKGNVEKFLGWAKLGVEAGTLAGKAAPVVGHAVDQLVNLLPHLPSVLGLG
jgi:hypothetical protein